MFQNQFIFNTRGHIFDRILKFLTAVLTVTFQRPYFSHNYQNGVSNVFYDLKSLQHSKEQ